MGRGLGQQQKRILAFVEEHGEADTRSILLALWPSEVKLVQGGTREHLTGDHNRIRSARRVLHDLAERGLLRRSKVEGREGYTYSMPRGAERH